MKKVGMIHSLPLRMGWLLGLFLIVCGVASAQSDGKSKSMEYDFKYKDLYSLTFTIAQDEFKLSLSKEVEENVQVDAAPVEAKDGETPETKAKEEEKKEEKKKTLVMQYSHFSTLRKHYWQHNKHNFIYHSDKMKCSD